MKTPSDLEMLHTLNAGYIRAVQASDAAWFEANLAPDFVNGNPDCTRSARAAYIAHVSRPAPISELRAADVRIQMLGDVAIIRARTTYAKPDGAPGAGRYTDVWMRREGRWICVCADLTRH